MQMIDIYRQIDISMCNGNFAYQQHLEWWSSKRILPWCFTSFNYFWFGNPTKLAIQHREMVEKSNE